MKRAVDVIFSIVGLVLLSPYLGIIALAIMLTSGRPVFFSQTRVGRAGKKFVMMKFRTMKVHFGTEAGIFKPGNKERVTSFGRFLRASKLDELPQLWNVLKGEMSLVGPRPEVTAWVAAYPDRWKTVLSIRPGITDPASLVYRDEESILAASPQPEKTYRDIIQPRKLNIYESYIRERSFFGDICVILETLGKIGSDKIKRNN